MTLQSNIDEIREIEAAAAPTRFARGWHCLGLTKDFQLTEKARLQFRAEAFNLTNETNFGDPNSSLGTTFGLVNSALPARELQFAGKIVF